MLRILYVIENIYFGGGERVFAQIIDGLDKEKYEIYVACIPHGEFIERIRDSVRIFPINLRNMFNFFNIWKLANLIKNNKIQIVHSQGGRADFFARVSARVVGVSAIVSTVAMPVEGYDIGFLKKAIYVRLDRFSQRFVTKFIVVSEALRKRLIKIHGVPSKKVVKIYNGVEIEPENNYQVPEIKKKIIQEFMMPEDSILIGAIGRLVWQKGLAYFIQALKQITDTNWQMADKIRCLIVGEGKERINLERRVRDLGLSNRVIFTGFRQDIKEILLALDVFILPSIQEGQPIILLEAMAMGRLIVATDIEGVNETIENGITGVLVPPEDSFALAEAIINLLGNREKTKKIEGNARSTVKQRFSLKEKINQYEQLYETLIEENIF